MKRRQLSTFALAIAIGLVASAPLRAGEPPAVAGEPQAQPEEAKPLAPPPGIMVTPATPPQVGTGVPGCPAGKLKPLELLV